MRLFRLTSAQHADDIWSGQGGLVVGGRWHSRGRRIVYTADSLALAQLEMLAHLGSREFAPDLVLAQAVLPDDLAITEVDHEQLPAGWRLATPYLPEVTAIGDAWLESNESAVLKVPSAVSPLDCNFLLNPEHPDFRRIRLGDAVPFEFDGRVSGQPRRQ